MPLQMNRREAICWAIGCILVQPATTKKDQPQIHYAYTQKGAELTNAQGKVLRRCYEYELARYIIHPEQPEIALLVEDGYNPRRIRSSGVRCRIDMLYILNETDLAPIPLPQEGERIIEVSRSKGRLRILDNDTEVFGADVATGKEGYTTPLGTFSIWLRRWAQRMQGTIDGGYNIPRIPWVNYVTKSGVAIHGAYWHNEFGQGAFRSHGCINLRVLDAQTVHRYIHPPMEGFQVEEIRTNPQTATVVKIVK